MKTKNTRKGFTTVELVIVIAVIAILATVLIPTFSNMIESANLSVDKQAVRNMNVCLAGSKIIYNDPSAAGNVRSYLREYGYGKEDNFKTKSKNHRICWYTDNTGDEPISVILLVNEALGTVVYPEEYTELRMSNDGLILGDNLFDLSVPLVLTDKNLSPDPIDAGGVSIELAVQYAFAADSEESDKYTNWKATFVVTADLGDNNKADILLVGKHNTNDWQFLDVSVTPENNTVDLIDKLIEQGFVGNAGLTYSDLQSGTIGVFHCGVVSKDWSLGQDPDGNEIDGCELYFNDTYPEESYSDPTGTSIKVELRLINPDVDNGSDYVVVGVYNYTFQ